MRRPVLALAVAIALVSCAAPPQAAPATSATLPTVEEASLPVLDCPFYERELFLRAMAAPRPYGAPENGQPGGRLIGGMVPHHLVASDMIAGFFRLAAKEPAGYDAVLIVSPSHFPENHKGDIATALAGWSTPFGGVACAEWLVEALLAAPGFSATESPVAVESDHGAAGLLPFVRYYLPGTPVACALLTNRLGRGELKAFREAVAGLCAEKNVLLLASVDCSHYLRPEEAAARDLETAKAIEAADFERILSFGDSNVDSPQALTALLETAAAQGAALTLLDHASSAEKLPYSGSNPIYKDGVTTYHVYAARAKPAEAKQAVIAVAGDIMLHEGQIKAAYDSQTGEYDFAAAFERIAPEISSADLAVANLETVFAGAVVGYAPQELAGGIPRFNAPDSLAAALKAAGFDLLTTANNHCMDHGEAGLLRTIETLDAAGLAHTGTFASAEGHKPLILDINGIRVAFAAFTQNTNGIPLPQGRPWIASDLSEASIAAKINAAKAESPDFIIALPHMGVEYEREPRPEYKALAERLLACGADAVLASHPHVVQPFETDGGFVAYSLGNFVSSQTGPLQDEGAIVKLRLTKTGGSRAELASVETVRTRVRLQDGQRVVEVIPKP
jgi:AmmeMemoRadiSam system protein B